MPRVLRILNRLNIGGPTYNAVYLNHYMAPAFESKLVAGSIQETEGDFSYIARERGIEPIVLPTMQRPIRPLLDWRAYRELRAIIREFKPDIVHTHAAKPGLLGRLAAIHERVPVALHTFHGHYFSGYFSPLKTKLLLSIERYLARNTQAIVAISPSQKQELVSTYRVAPAQKVRIVPNGYELARFAEHRAQRRAAFRQAMGLGPDDYAVGVIGRLVAVKNHALFLQAFAELKALALPRRPRAFIIGDGELRQELEALCQALGLTYGPRAAAGEVDVVFYSWEADVASLLPGLDLVALSSVNEGTPVCLIEAQAAQVPVLSTDVGGVRDTMHADKAGLVVPAGDVRAFAGGMAQLMQASPEALAAMGRAGQAFVEARYGVQRLVSDMSALYTQLLAGQSKH